jgi:hypothetical protein
MDLSGARVSPDNDVVDAHLPASVRPASAVGAGRVLRPHWMRVAPGGSERCGLTAPPALMAERREGVTAEGDLLPAPPSHYARVIVM